MDTMIDSRKSRRMIAAGALFAMLAVIIGAFAAHGLQQVLSAYALELVKTGARYQMYHALGLVLAGVLSMCPGFSSGWLKFAAGAFGLGIVVFSGSLYILALSGISGWGAVTPFGGVAFIFGWLAMAVAVLGR